jgi:cytoskeletal protein CcmA (bactofilin family)
VVKKVLSFPGAQNKRPLPEFTVLDHNRAMDPDRQHNEYTRLSANLVVSGDLAAAQDIVIDGCFDGQIEVPNHHLSIGRSASVRAKIVARSVTILGSLVGNILASEGVEVLAGASVRGHVTTPSITLVDGAQFTGTIDPQRTEAAMHVARYRERHAE